MEAGQLSADVLLPFATQLEKEYGNLASSSTTFAQAINRIQTEWTLLMKRIGDTGAWNAITNILSLIGKNAEVLAGSLGAGLGVAIFGLIKGIGGWIVAMQASVVSMTAQMTTAEKLRAVIGWTTTANELAAKAAAKKAADELLAANNEVKRLALTEQAAQKAIATTARSVEADQLKIRSMLAANVVVDQVTLATQKQLAAEESLNLAKNRSVAAIAALAEARLAEASAMNVGSIAANNALKSAVAEQASASARLRFADLRVAAQLKIVAAINQTVLAEQQASANGQASTATVERQLVALTKLVAYRERLTAATERHTLSEQKLVLAQDQVTLSGNQELLAAQRLTAQRERDALAANRSLVNANNAVLAAQRQVASLTAQGATAEVVARANANLAISQDAASLAANRHKIAADQLAVSKAKEAAAILSADNANKKLAVSQGILARSWGLLTGPTGMIALMVAGFAYMAYAFRDQDEATKTLSKSTEEYTQEIEKLTAAQLALLESKANEGVDDNKQRIQNIKDEIDYLNKRLEKEREGIAFYEARKLSVYGVINSLKVWLSTEELLTQAQADLDEATNQLTINEGKQALAITELASRYDELVVAEKNHSKTVADTNADINEQRKSIDSARVTLYEMISTYGVWSKEAAAARANVGKATEGLISLQEKQTNQAVVLKNTQDQSTKAIDAYVKATGASREAVLAGLSGDQQAIDKLDAKSKAIALSVQSLLRLTDEE